MDFFRSKYFNQKRENEIMKASKEGGRGREKGRQREGRREGVLAKNVFFL